MTMKVCFLPFGTRSQESKRQIIRDRNTVISQGVPGGINMHPKRPTSHAHGESQPTDGSSKGEDDGLTRMVGTGICFGRGGSMTEI